MTRGPSLDPAVMGGEQDERHEREQRTDQQPK